MRVVNLITLAITCCIVLSCNSTRYELIWQDDFENITTPDPSKWNIETGNGCPDLCGFGNNELQYYTNHKNNLWIEDGKLHIRAMKDTLGQHGYTSAKLTTKHKGDWKYGKVEVRAKLPYGTGTWPAIWMLPTKQTDMKWPDDGEIDIMEHVGHSQGWVYGTLHTAMYNGMMGNQKSDSVFLDNAHNQFHTYAIEWDHSGIEWFVNNKKFNSIRWADFKEENWPFDSPFHLIINLAVGGNWGGEHGIDPSIWPQIMEIDYVKIYQ